MMNSHISLTNGCVKHLLLTDCSYLRSKQHFYCCCEKNVWLVIWKKLILITRPLSSAVVVANLSKTSTRSTSSACQIGLPLTCSSIFRQSINHITPNGSRTEAALEEVCKLERPLRCKIKLFSTLHRLFKPPSYSTLHTLRLLKNWLVFCSQRVSLKKEKT